MHPLTLLLSLIVICVSWIHAGTRPLHLGMIPWLALAACVTTLVRPQRKRDESIKDARSRVARSVFRDPVFYAFIVLLLLLWVQNLNSPRLPQPIIPKSPLMFDPPPVPWLPWSVDSFLSLEVLVWFVMAFAIVIGVRHGLLKAARRNLLTFCCWNGAALSLFGIIQYADKVKMMYGFTPMTAYFFASFGYQNHAGAYFTFLFIISLALFFHRLEADDDQVWKTWLLLIPMALNFTGALLALSRASIILSVASLGLFGVYAFIRFWPVLSAGIRIKLALLAAVIIAAGAIGFYNVSGNIFQKELGNTDWTSFLTSRVLHTREDDGGYQVPMAYKMWADYPAFGVGAWGYQQFISQYLPRENWRFARGVGQANVHNDFVQYLAEHGAVGAGALLVIVCALLFACIKPLFQYQAPEYTRKSFFFRLPFVSLFTLAAAIFMILDSIIDIPFRSPPCIAVWCIGLLCASSFTPASWRRSTSNRNSNELQD